MVRYFGLWTKIYGSFVLYMVIDLFLVGLLVNVRASRETGLFLADRDVIATFVLWPTVFLLQHIMVFWSFANVYRKEEKYEIRSEEATQLKYHYFSAQQLLIFLQITSKEVTGYKDAFRKIFVTKEPQPKLSSFQLLGRRVIVLNPTILQIAQTSELRANLAIDFSISGHSSFIRLYAQQNRAFWFLPFLAPFVPLLREIILIFITPTESRNFLMELLTLFFTLIIVFGLMNALRWVVNLLIKTSNRNMVLMADLKAAEMVGATAVINTLLKLGQRQEAVEVLLDEMRYLEELEQGQVLKFEEIKLLQLVQNFPIAQIDRDAARQMAPEVFLEERFATLRKIYHCDIKEEEETIEEAADRLRKQRSSFIDEWKQKAQEDEEAHIPKSVELQLRIENCLAIDSLVDDPAGVLTDEEIEIILKEIKENPKQPLFAHEPPKTKLWSLEPTIADRITSVNRLPFRG